MIGNAELHHGDSMKIMADMAAQGRKFGMICTDPPYKLTSGGPSGLMRGAFDPKNYNNNGSIVTCNVKWKEFMPLMSALMDDGHAYIMANDKNVHEMLNTAKDAGFRFHNLLVWDKITCTANRWYAKNLEFVGFFFKGKGRMINDCGTKQLIRCQQIDETEHPTEKPVPLMQGYIRNSKRPGDVVFDPFMGTGTTGVAAVGLGADFVGVELEENYFNVAKARIGRVNMPTLF